MIVGGELNKSQLAELRKTLASADLPPAKRQRLLWRLAKYGLIAAAKRNVRNQADPDGKVWPGRQSKRKGKMLRNLPKLLHIRDMPEISAVRVYLQGGGYRNGTRDVPAGVVAYSQQNGMNVSISRRSVPRKPREDDDDKMATPAQAKRLRALGYRVRKGKRWRKPSAKEIKESMEYDQAGAVILEMSGKTVKKSWTIDLPAREFLGISDEDFSQALARQLQGIGFGWNVKAQDIKGK